MSKIRFATPEARCKSFPINATSGKPVSTFTVQYWLNSSNNSGESNSTPDEAEPVLSKVNAMLTSEVVIVSTEILYFAKIVNTFARKPCACNILRLESVNRV